jgi:DNA repair exonuclease SbcCD ATPase subunit
MKEQYMQFGIAQKNEEVEALRARVAELEKERDYYASEDEKLLNEIGLLLDDVKYAGSYSEGVRVLLAKVEELEKDASRYRWLRDAQKYWDFSDSMFITFSSEEHDAAIDAARGEGDPKRCGMTQDAGSNEIA